MNTGYTKMYRSRDERIFGGVCAGLGKQLGIETNVVRWAFVLTAEVTLPLYILLWICIPEALD